MTPLNQLRQIFSGASHIKENQAKPGLFAYQGGENCFVTYRDKDNIPLDAFNIHLFKRSASEFPCDSFAQ